MLSTVRRIRGANNSADADDDMAARRSSSSDDDDDDDWLIWALWTLDIWLVPACTSAKMKSEVREGEEKFMTLKVNELILL